MRIKDERGSALIEFVTIGIALQLALYLAGSQVFHFQAIQLAAEAASRHALRAFLISGEPIEKTVRSVLKDFGALQQHSQSLGCSPDCVSSGSVITVTVTVEGASSTSLAVR
ncbi:unannotated protein [freshwater metagenome]|uniref:Unannotated protein n=1 Tax=freshwater metagenome TaxID=449393 RepID=A0A6J6I385_9ZZZZ